MEKETKTYWAEALLTMAIVFFSFLIIPLAIIVIIFLAKHV